MKEKKKIDSSRMIFAETGFSPTSVIEEKISISDVVLESINVFEVNPKTSLITFKKDAVDTLIKSKQRAVFYNDWVLALYPTDERNYIPILVNRKTGKWTDDLTTSFAKSSPAVKMLNGIKKFYGDEVGGRIEE